MKLIVPSPAKVNLSLWVNGKRSDGYHEIVTVMQAIRLFDFITIEESDRFKLSIEGQNRIDTKDNLIKKACRLFEKLTGINPKVKIVLEKRIPIGAGLGGGSSNAASTLKALNNIFGKPLSNEELLVKSQMLGSDVPFFIRGGLAIAYGRGEKLKFFEGKPFKLLLAMPDIFCSTQEVYKNLHAESKISLPEAEKLIVEPIINGDWGILKTNLHNDLESSDAPCISKVKDIKNYLEGFGLKFLMTGSGSSLFSLDTDIPLKNSDIRLKLVSTL